MRSTGNLGEDAVAGFARLTERVVSGPPSSWGQVIQRHTDEPDSPSRDRAAASTARPSKADATTGGADEALDSKRSAASRFPLAFLLVGALLFVAAVAVVGFSAFGRGERDGGPESVTTSAPATPTGTVLPASPESPAGAESTDSPGTAALIGARYIGNTGGGGVGLRDDCLLGARSGGAWPEGSTVVVLEAGSGRCADWSYVAGAGGASWVANQYLVDTPPASSPNTSSAPAGTQAPPSSPPPVSTAATPTPPRLPATAVPPLEFLAIGGMVLTTHDLDDRAILRGGDTGYVYLGLISSSKIHPDSICNPSGDYGSPSSPLSVRNDSGQYGKPRGGSIYEPFFNSDYSAYNTEATQPPRVILDDTLVGWLTTNVGVFEANIIDPDALFASLGCSY